MNTKAILVLVVIVLLAGGGYYLYQNGTLQLPGSPAAPGATAPTDTVQAEDISEGTGEEAVPGTIVSVLYVGRLEDGTVFDSSEEHDNEPLTFQLGTPGIIAGFQIGINGMREEGERRLIVPPTLGYGDQDVRDPDGNVIIPANSNLVFDVKLIAVQEAPEEATPAEGTGEAQ